MEVAVARAKEGWSETDRQAACPSAVSECLNTECLEMGLSIQTLVSCTSMHGDSVPMVTSLLVPSICSLMFLADLAFLVLKKEI